MKKIAHLLAIVAFFTVVTAHGLNMPAGLSSALRDAVEASKVVSTSWRIPQPTEFVPKFDRGITKAFEKAWQRSMNGTSSIEGVVLIFRMTDGSYTARELGATNEYKQFTFRWQPSIIAVVHTHPNSNAAEPQGLDLELAHKRRVPIFTITNRGMYVYDPGTKKTSLVLDGLDWLEAEKFSKTLLGTALKNEN